MTESPSPFGAFRPAKGKKPYGVVLIVAIALIALFGGLFLWKQVRTAPKPMGAPPPTPVSAMVIQPQTAPASLQTVGTLQAVREVMLAPEIAGRVTTIGFEGGARVGAGALLVQLDDGPERADRAAAAARAEYAQKQYDRSQQLKNTGAEPRQLLDQRKSELDEARAAVQQLDARIAQKKVRAPFGGVLGLRKVNSGQYMNPGDPIASLTALDRLFVNFTVPQQQLGQLRVGGVVEVSADAWPGRVFQGRVNAIEPMVGTDTRNVSVQAVLPNPGDLLRPGMYVTARLLLAPQTDAILVPTSAIQTSAAGDSVVVIRGANAAREGTAEFVPVQTGRRIGNQVVIDKGVKAGDVIVTEGQLRVQPGAKLSVASKSVK